MDRKNVGEMDQNLVNLKRVLQNVFPNIEKYSLDKAILVIGNTGCGKSTLLTALLFGPEVLEEKVLSQKKLIKRNGKMIERIF